MTIANVTMPLLMVFIVVIAWFVNRDDGDQKDDPPEVMSSPHRVKAVTRK